MPAVLESRPAQLPADARRKLTRQDCRALAEAGLLDGDRFELIDGELIRKMPKSPLHNLALLLLVEWLRGVFGARYVHQESSIDLSPSLMLTNEPEPDAVVLRRPSADFPGDNPGPADILLIAPANMTSAPRPPFTPVGASPNTGCSIYPSRALWCIATPTATATAPSSPMPSANR